MLRKQFKLLCLSVSVIGVAFFHPSLCWGQLFAIDPVCRTGSICDGKLLNDVNGKIMLNDAKINEFVTSVIARDAVVTDGVTKLLLRIKTNETVVFSIKDSQGNLLGPEWGRLMTFDETVSGNSIAIPPRATPFGNYALALYQAPADLPCALAGGTCTFDNLRGDLNVRLTAVSSSISSQKLIRLYEPPVVLIHDIWQQESDLTEMTDYLTGLGFLVCEFCSIKYAALNPAPSFSPIGNTPDEKYAIQTLMTNVNWNLFEFRVGKNGAITQVDVVAHGAGALLARARVAATFDAYQRTVNYKRGDFRKIITVGSPLRGTKFADYLATHQCDPVALGHGNGYLKKLFDERFQRPFGASIFDLQTNSLVIEKFGETSVPTHAIVGLSSDDSVTEDTWNFILNLAGAGGSSLDNLIGQGGGHDTFVSAESQGGRLSQAAVSTRTSLVHNDLDALDEDNDIPEIRSQAVFDLVKFSLLAPLVSGQFGSIPALIRTTTPVSPRNCVEPGPPPPTTGRIVLTPSDGMVVVPGDTVNIHADITNGNPVDGALFSIGHSLIKVDGPPPYSFLYNVTSDHPGGDFFVGVDTFGPGPENYSAAATWTLDTGRDPEYFEEPRITNTVLTEAGAISQVVVEAEARDGTLLDVSHHTAGTTYATLSGTDDILSVSQDGKIVVHGDGFEKIVVTRGQAFFNVEMNVAFQNPVLSPIGNKTIDVGFLLRVNLFASDPNGDPLTFTAQFPQGSQYPGPSNLIDHGDGTAIFEWGTAQNFGDYSFEATFIVTDPEGHSDSETITIRVNQNFPPTLDPIGNQSVVEEEAITFTVTASDPDQDPLTLKAEMADSSPISTIGASFTDNGDGTGVFHWVPEPGQRGDYNIVFFVIDPYNSADSENVTVSVFEPGPRPPVLIPIGNRSVREEEPLIFPVRASDPDGDPLTFTAMLSNGSLLSSIGANFLDNGDGTGVFRWTPVQGQIGNYSIVISVQDPGGLSDQETINIAVMEAEPLIQLLSPSQGSILTTPQITFEWTNNQNVQEAWLAVGTTEGNGEILYWEQVWPNLSKTVNVSVNGGPVYFELRYRIGIQWFRLKKKFLTSVQIIQPALFSTITTETVTFQWTGRPDVTEAWLAVGTSAGKDDILKWEQVWPALSKTVSNIPLAGGLVHARLSYRVGTGPWTQLDTVYNTLDLREAAVKFSSPVKGTAISSAAVSFSWDNPGNVSEMWFAVGTASGKSDILAWEQVWPALSKTVGNIPLTGKPVFAEYWYKQSGKWFQGKIVFETADRRPAPFEFTNLFPWDTLSSTTVIFEWMARSDITEAWIAMSRKPELNPQDILKWEQVWPQTSKTVSNIPLTGNPVYLEFWYKVGIEWIPYKVKFKTPNLVGNISLLSPAPGAPLTTTPVTFQWSNRTDVTEAWLAVGTKEGGDDVSKWAQVWPNLSKTVNNIPLTGNPVYFEFWYKADGGTWFSIKQTFMTQAPPPIALTNPVSGSTITTSTVTFQWTNRPDVTEAWLAVGTTSGKDEVFKWKQVWPGLSQTVDNIPLTGRPVYFDFWYKASGTWIELKEQFPTAVP